MRSSTKISRFLEVLRAVPSSGSLFNLFSYRTVSRIPNPNTKAVYSNSLMISFINRLNLGIWGLNLILLLGLGLGLGKFWIVTSQFYVYSATVKIKYRAWRGTAWITSILRVIDIVKTF